MDKKIYEKKPSECNCLNIRRASQALTDVYDEIMAPSGLKLGQFSLLKHINRLGPVSVSDLALSIRLDRTTLVRNLKSLEEKGLVTDTAPERSRNRQLQLTELGYGTYRAAEQLWLEAQNFVEQYLGREDTDLLTKLLSKIEALVP